MTTDRPAPGGTATHRELNGTGLLQDVPACTICQRPMGWKNTSITIMSGQACSLATYCCADCEQTLLVRGQ